MLIADLASLWGKAMMEFLKSLRDILGDTLLMFISLPEEYPFIYESNVLVVVERDDVSVIKSVLDVKREVERMFEDKVSINPLIVTKKEERIINAFKNMMTEQLPSKELWDKAINEFTKKLYASNLAVQILALNPNEQLYESNVLVVVERDDVSVIKSVLDVKREVERMFEDKVSINPLIVTKKEERIINAFKNKNTTN